MQAGRLAEAVGYAEQAVAGSRVCLRAHGLLATLHLNLGQALQAEQVVTQALACETGVADAYDGLAHVSMLLGQHQRSNALYRRVVELAPQSARFWYNLASSERSVGRLAQAQAAANRAIALDRAHYPSYLLRSELCVQSRDGNHVEQLQALLREPQLEDRARLFLGFALGKELDDLQRFDEAFAAFAAAAAVRRRHLAYDVGVDERKLQRIAEAFPSAAMPQTQSAADSARYIFILGLPRSGTTLLERILSALPDVHSNGETDHFSRALLAASPADGGDVFARAAAADPSAIAAGYRRLAQRADSATHIIEKLPLNYLYVGAIRRALPQAKIVLVTRTPIDSCFAMYRTLFGEAYPFSYELRELAGYYAAYEGLMQHWLRLFGDAIHRVAYEDLVHAPRTHGARVARFCGLNWDDAAIDIQNNAAASLTASAAQIRRPIYGSSSGRWRHYHHHLAPLIQALREHGVALPAEAT